MASSDAATVPGICDSKYGKGIRSPLPPYGVVSDKQNSPADFLQRTADGSRAGEDLGDR